MKKKKDDKASKNSTDILGFESRLKQKEDTLNDLEREASFFTGNYCFNQQSYLIYEPKTFSFKQTAIDITHWKSTGIDNYSLRTDLRGGTKMNVAFSGDYVKENKSIQPTKSAINIYIVYKLDTIKSTNLQTLLSKMLCLELLKQLKTHQILIIISILVMELLLMKVVILALVTL